MSQTDKLFIDYGGVVLNHYDHGKLQSIKYNTNHEDKIHCLFLNNSSVLKLTSKGWIHKKTKKNFNFYDVEKKEILQINVKDNTVKKLNRSTGSQLIEKKNRKTISLYQ